MHVCVGCEATKEKLKEKAKKATRKAKFRESGVWGDYWRHLNRRKESASWKGCVVRQVSSCKFAYVDSRGRDDESVTILYPAMAVLESLLGLYRRLVPRSGVIALFFIFFLSILLVIRLFLYPSCMFWLKD